MRFLTSFNQSVGLEICSSGNLCFNFFSFLNNDSCLFFNKINWMFRLCNPTANMPNVKTLFRIVCTVSYLCSPSDKSSMNSTCLPVLLLPFPADLLLLGIGRVTKGETLSRPNLFNWLTKIIESSTRSSPAYSCWSPLAIRRWRRRSNMWRGRVLCWSPWAIYL